MLMAKINNFLTKIIVYYYGLRYKHVDNDFEWIKKDGRSLFFNTASNSSLGRKVIGIVVGYGWGYCDALIPLMKYIKDNTNAVIITLLTCDNAGERRKLDKERWKDILSNSDAILFNNSITHRPFRGNKRKIKNERKKKLYFSSLEKNLCGILFDAYLVCDEFEQESCAMWLWNNQPKAKSCGIDPCTYTDIEVDYSVFDISPYLSINYDYYCMSAKQRQKTIPLKFLNRFIYTGSPRTDYWFIKKREEEALKFRSRISKKTDKIVAFAFPNLYYTERFYNDLRSSFREALYELAEDNYAFLLKFHPKNDMRTIRQFIKEYFPSKTKFRIVTCDNTTLSFVSDVVVNVGISDSRPDFAVSRKFFIEYCDEKVIMMHCKEHGFSIEIDGNRRFWSDRGMSTIAKDKKELVASIRKELLSPTTGADYDSIFPKDRNVSKIVSDYLLTGIWSDQVYKYSKRALLSNHE